MLIVALRDQDQQDRDMLVETKNVSTTLPAGLVSKLDRRLKRKCIKRAEWLRNAVLKAAQAEGLLKMTSDGTADGFDLDLLEGVAA